MFTLKKKGLLHSVLAVALAVTIGQCAWAAFDANGEKLALSVDMQGENLIFREGSTVDTEEYIIDAENPEAASLSTTTRLTGNIQIAGTGKKITVSLRDADVKQVLRMFADKAGMNIVFHSSASGVVTLDLKDVSLNEALEFVLDACELTYIRQDNNIIIASKEAAKDLSYARQNFTTIPVRYANANSVAKFLNKTMFNGKYQGVSTVPIVAVNAAKNELLIFGTEEDERLARKILARLDTRPMMNVYPVNHVTPAEMAATICDTIMSDKSEGGSANGTQISTNSRSGGGGDKIELGGGYVACVVGEKNGSIDQGESLEDIENYTSNPFMIAFYPDLGTIATYGGSREQAKMIEAFIKLHDKKQPMAYIELSLIELNETGSKIFNTDWKIWTPIGGFQFNDTGFQTTTDAPIFFKGDHYDVKSASGQVTNTIYKYHGWGPIVMSLNYLVSNGKGRVLASPKIMVTNGKKSTIDLTSDYLKSIKQQFDTSSTTAVAQTTYEIGNDQGVKVDITPFISPDGYVVMTLKPDYSTITGRGPNGEYTLLSRRNLELENVRVKDGETLVLAGMVQEDETVMVTKIPVLGDLPLVGTFFRRSNTDAEKKELVILITPHIVYSKEQVENMKKKQESI